MLDIGAGTGRDAAALAALGHSVVAVGPTAELRGHGQRIHAGSAVEWVDDALPALSLHQCSGRFAAVFATAVWMHLDAEERGLAMARIAALLMPGGQFFATPSRACARWPSHVRRVLSRVPGEGLPQRTRLSANCGRGSCICQSRPMPVPVRQPSIRCGRYRIILSVHLTAGRAPGCSAAQPWTFTIVMP
ncbi:class I SAM-dependent methyltransferase [Streptomyces microflavus]|uniref:class I SAM-dependent methyltransferase n=1 Tax=Streptomyces microflavus TaxID=1919 RepID=UPI00382BAD1E